MLARVAPSCAACEHNGVNGEEMQRRREQFALAAVLLC